MNYSYKDIPVKKCIAGVIGCLNNKAIAFRVRQSLGAREQCSKAASSFVGSRGKKRRVNKERKKEEGKRERKREKRGEKKKEREKEVKTRGSKRKRATKKKHIEKERND